MQTKIIYNSLAFIFLSICGCALERIPASVSVSDSQQYNTKIEPCVWQSFQQTRTSLFPSIRLIDCEVVGQLVPETVEFKFEMGTELRGQQSKKVVESVELETGNNGVMYYLNYAPDGGVQESLGSWLGWLQDSEPPDAENLLPNDDGEVHLESDGAIVYRAAWNIEKAPRGLAFVLCGFGALTPPCKMLGNELLEDGWAIVYVYTVLNAPKFGSKIELSNDKGYVASAIELLDLKYCQVAAATQAVRARMEKKFPSIKSLPIVIVGISAGALNTPAVYHEMKEDVDAVVLVAGGANMLDIIQNGAFTKWRLTHDGGNTFTNDELKNIEIKYLKQPSRDPYHLAPTLPHENLLLIHAKYDAIVPAENGNLLWERAGYPERWIFSGGHLGLFIMFEKYAEDIADWLESKNN